MRYTITHLDFNYPVQGGVIVSKTALLHGTYAVPVRVAVNALRKLQRAYSELYCIYDIWKHGKREPWVQICHYRRIMDAPDTATCLPEPIHKNMNAQYARCHNLQDLLDCEQIIREKYAAYALDFDALDKIYPCNMFVLCREDFEAYCAFVFGVLGEFCKRRGLKTDADVLEYVKGNRDKYADDRWYSAEYQARLLGYLAERVGTIFFVKYFEGKQVQHAPIQVLGERLWKIQ